MPRLFEEHMWLVQYSARWWKARLRAAEGAAASKHRRYGRLVAIGIYAYRNSPVDEIGERYEEILITAWTMSWLWNFTTTP